MYPLDSNSKILTKIENTSLLISSSLLSSLQYKGYETTFLYFFINSSYSAEAFYDLGVKYINPNGVFG